ncbi:hypothetical protein EVA_14327 [gut metagenome]|uniref:Uncharacterized protein n=1 Tax=gut metagenome TaxID=749906 RepID=J9FRL4_9ZZZZ
MTEVHAVKTADSYSRRAAKQGIGQTAKNMHSEVTL